MRKRISNNPSRRLAEVASISEADVDRLEAMARYVGSGHHKKNPADYGFDRASPRPTKSICDTSGIVFLGTAQALMISGIKMKMISAIAHDGFPKYIWSVGENGRVYESKTHPNTPAQYHGYPLENDDDMREYILSEWKKRL